MKPVVAVVGIPIDANSSFLKGPAEAPAAIRDAYYSESSNFYTESGRDLNENGAWSDVGDLDVSDVEPFDEVSRKVEELARNHSKLFVLGGDHSITYPVVRGLHAVHGKLSILHLDAHPDLYDNFGGNPHSHASPFARILDDGMAKRLVQVGIRTLNKHQKEQAKKFGVEIIEMKYWRDDHKFSFEGPVYLSLDMDAIGPAYAPGVSHHEPGGATPAPNAESPPCGCRSCRIQPHPRSVGDNRYVGREVVQRNVRPAAPHRLNHARSSPFTRPAPGPGGSTRFQLYT
jgi:arginase